MAPHVIWHRRDLRLADLPALHAALEGASELVPLFVLDERLLAASPSRTAFVLGCLRELHASYRARGGGGLVCRVGRGEEVVPAFADEIGAARVTWTSDPSPFSLRRDRAVREALGDRARPCPGQYAVDIGQITTAAGDSFDVFSPFHRRQRAALRRPVLGTPDRVPSHGVAGEPIPDDPAGGVPSPSRAPGETAARGALDAWLSDDGIGRYAERVKGMARRHGSELAAYLRHGCLSVRECEQRALDRGGPGSGSWVRQLAWRDFHAHVLLRRPANLRQAHQPRYRGGVLRFDDRPDLADAWRAGRTGFPLVDAGMRQLRATGYMPNRVRLVVASFFTKDLHLDPRLGERHFLELLLCGEAAQNNGNWQWITGTGTDPAPPYRRVYNPERQREAFDPDGAYVARWAPDSHEIAPIVDHLAERREALKRFGEAASVQP